MNPVKYLLLAVFAFGNPQNARAEDVVVRLVNVSSGAGVGGCYIALYLGDPWARPIPSALPITKYVQTAADGRATFRLPQPSPDLVTVEFGGVDCATSCDRIRPVSVEEIARVGFAFKTTGGTYSSGAQVCRPNDKKLVEIVAKPGEMLVYVRKLSWLERLTVH